MLYVKRGFKLEISFLVEFSIYSLGRKNVKDLYIKEKSLYPHKRYKLF